MNASSLLALILAVVTLAATLTSAEGAPSHPRIFLTPADTARLRAMAADKTRNALGLVPAEGSAAIKARADEFVATTYHYAVSMPGAEGGPAKMWAYTFSDQPPPRHDDYGHYPPWTAMFQEGSDAITTRISCLTFAYLITGEAKYLDKARGMVLNLCAWPGIWTDPSYGGGQPCLDTGHAAAWVGIFYDWCYDALTEAQRKTIRQALIDKALVPIDQLMDKVTPYHNYTAVIANGLCLGAIAVRGEDPRAQGWIDHALARAQLNFDAQGKDGGPMEGPMYGTYAADNFADMIWGLSTADIPNRLVEHPYLKSLPRYCISLLCPANWQQPCFGDGGPGVGFGRLMMSLALRGDTGAAWYCQKTGQLTANTVRGFIALDPARLKPAQPTANPSDCFVDVGYAILRDSYNPDSAFLAFKCGPPEAVVGHNHFDQGSFVINYRGGWCAWDPGYRSYFNPPERRYSTGTLGHSSVILDLDEAYLKSQADNSPGHDQVNLDRGRITEFATGPMVDYLCGSVAEAYNTDKLHVLDRFDRQIVLVKPRLFLVRDTLAAPQAHTYSALLHATPGGEFQISGDRIMSLGPTSMLQAHVYSPDGIKLTAAEYPGAENRGPYLAATTGRTAATTILSVLVPRADDRLITNPGFEKGLTGWQRREMPGVTENHVIDSEVKHSGNASARIDRGGYYYSRHFTLKPGTRITAQWWAKCTAKRGASSVLYYWRDEPSFANTPGPVADVDEWKQYQMTATVPEGTQEICLALQFFGEGRCWYDDVEIATDPPARLTPPAQVSPLAQGTDGAVAELDEVVHVFLCGNAGKLRTIEAAGHRFTTDAELAVVSLKPGGAVGWMLRGTTLRVDGRTPMMAGSTWRVRRP